MLKLYWLTEAQDFDVFFCFSVGLPSAIIARDPYSFRPLSRFQFKPAQCYH